MKPLVGIGLFLFIFVPAVMLNGCTSTVVPKDTVAKAPSFDGNIQDSGVTGIITNHVTHQAWYGITAHKRDEFNMLVQIYGKQFTPPLVKDYGITEGEPIGTYEISVESLIDLGMMENWKRSGRKP